MRLGECTVLKRKAAKEIRFLLLLQKRTKLLQCDTAEFQVTVLLESSKGARWGMIICRTLLNRRILRDHTKEHTWPAGECSAL